MESEDLLWILHFPRALAFLTLLIIIILFLKCWTAKVAVPAKLPETIERSPTLELPGAWVGWNGSETYGPLWVAEDALEEEGLCWREVPAPDRSSKHLPLESPLLLKMGILWGFRFFYPKKENLLDKQVTTPLLFFTRTFHFIHTALWMNFLTGCIFG